MTTKTFSKMTVDDLEPSRLRGKRIFMRVDFNVPMKEGLISDDTRIRATLPTIERLRSCGARLVLASHLGRPKSGPDPQYSLRPVAQRLGELLGTQVVFRGELTGPSVEKASRDLPEAGVMLLENVRFDPGETKNDTAFSEELAKLGDLYVNDAFGSCHRAHATTVGVPSRLRPAVAGLLLKRELEYIGTLLASPRRPFVAVLGGAKISDKIQVFKNLLGRVDSVLVGGAMASTFFRAKGYGVGTSLVEEDLVGIASEVMAEYEKSKVPLILPTDCVVSKSASAALEMRDVPADSIPSHCAYVDIGPASRRMFAGTLESGRTIVWNGPMGVFEVNEFAAGTRDVAKAVALAAEKGAVAVVGGGDSVKAVLETGYAEKLSHLSTGGGAFLEVLEGKELPGVAVLSEAGEGGA